MTSNYVTQKLRSMRTWIRATICPPEHTEQCNSNETIRLHPQCPIRIIRRIIEENLEKK